MNRAKWRIAQAAVWAVGVAIVAALVFAPEIGLHALWNVLIPVAPALLAVAPGLWRNICPLGTTSLLPAKLGFGRAPLSPSAQGALALGGVALLVAIVPLRHASFNFNGPASAALLAGAAAAAVAAGFAFKSKSGWCSGLCPVQPVERLYGPAPVASLPNAHCTACVRCVARCPDSAPDPNRTLDGDLPARRVAATLMTGGFAGFVWGFFQVPDGATALASLYGPPMIGAAVTLAAYLTIRPLAGRRLDRAFAALAIGAYYWFRIPMLFGFGAHPGDGVLVDLRGALPAWFPIASVATTSLLVAAWFASRSLVSRAWLVRPPYAADEAPVPDPGMPVSCLAPTDSVPR